MKGVKVFQKGVSGNTEGRTKGTPSKTTAEARALMESVLYNEIDNIYSSLLRIRTTQGDAKYIEALTKLLVYVMPKKLDIEQSGGLNITWKEERYETGKETD